LVLLLLDHNKIALIALDVGLDLDIIITCDGRTLSLLET
jgi:hypothetical protein